MCARKHVQWSLPGLSASVQQSPRSDRRLIIAAVTSLSQMALSAIRVAVVKVVTGTRDSGPQQM